LEQPTEIFEHELDFSNICYALKREEMLLWLDLEQGHLKGLSSLLLRKNLSFYIENLITDPPKPPQPYGTDLSYVDYKYIMYWTDEELLSLIADSIAETHLDSLLPLEPSSTLILEFYEAPGPFIVPMSFVRAYLND